MATREVIPKQIKAKLLDEYDHRCAVCGGDRPHVHHIDENATNNDIKNLLPLCPNCHLRDQHNPTRKIEIVKLQLFRSYKDPAILKPQFHPIYVRQLFLDEIAASENATLELEQKVKELIAFVSNLEMGNFYAQRLQELLGPLRRAHAFSLSGRANTEYENALRVDHRDYRNKLINNRGNARDLLVELLRYQSWASED